MSTIEDNERLERAVEAASEKKWDLRFLEMAMMVASWSKDPSTKCGAVIVRPDRSIVSTGFNGFPRGCDDSGSVYADRDLKLARVVHAEVNAVLLARQDVRGCTLYTWPPGYGPTCDRCASVVIQAGITRVVHVIQETDFASRWMEPCRRGLDMYREAGVTVEALAPPPCFKPHV